MKKLLLLTIIFFVGCHNVDNVDVPFENLDSDEVFSYDTDPLPTLVEIQGMYCDAVYDCGSMACVPDNLLATDCDTESHDFKMCQANTDGIYCDESQGLVYAPEYCAAACKRQ